MNFVRQPRKLIWIELDIYFCSYDKELIYVRLDHACTGQLRTCVRVLL